MMMMMTMMKKQKNFLKNHNKHFQTHKNHLYKTKIDQGIVTIISIIMYFFKKKSGLAPLMHTGDFCFSSTHYKSHCVY